MRVLLPLLSGFFMSVIEKILSQVANQALMNKVLQLIDENHVLQTRFSDGFFMARVKDDQGRIFTTHADLKNWQPQQAKCMCGQLMPCIHLLAGMQSWLNARNEGVKTPQSLFSAVSWKQASKATTSRWQLDVALDTQNGFEYQLSVEQDQNQWNLVDLIVYLLETYSYSELMKQSDDSIIEVLQQEGQCLRLDWWRVKWFLQQVVDAKWSIKRSKINLGMDWKAIKALQTFSEKSNDGNHIWMANSAWQQMNWLLDANQLSGEDCIPHSFTVALRDYQLQGVRWLRSLQLAGFGGILADDMGLGKTIQMLAYLLKLKELNQLSKTALIVVPTSLLVNWQDEAKQFAPNLNIQVFHGKTRAHQNWQDAEVLITSYGMVQRHAALFKSFHFSHIILDEAQLIKNFQSQKSQVLKSLQSDVRFCLSGTPMENHLGELWSLIDFVVPNLLGSRHQFRKLYQVPIQNHQNHEAHEKLLARIQPFLLRRTKKQVLQNLPSKTRIEQKIVLSDAQKDLYETVRALLADKVQTALAEKGLVNSRWVVLDALLKLRQICCSPALLPTQWNPQQITQSAKLNQLMEMLASLLDEGRSVLVFSQFTKMLALIEQELQLKQYPYQTLTGQTQRRDVLVRRFQQGEVPIFLLSLKAGGLGLNLTKADTVIHFEPWWNPAVSAQATDRIYRIGQEQPVFEYHLITSGSIEEQMLALQQTKFQLFAKTIDEVSESKMQWTEENIMKFFAPLPD
jgi:SNF2 family DNA or RNA helicase